MCYTIFRIAHIITMVVSILLLTVSLILTFGRSSIRFFDRLNISFSQAILLQFILLAVAIMPHLKIEGGKSVLNALCYLFISIIALVYFFQNRYLLRWNLIIVVAFSVLIYLLALVVLSRVIGDSYGVALLLSLVIIATVFSLSLSFKIAFLSVFLTVIFSFFLTLFTPLYYAIQFGSIHTIIIDSIIPALFVLMLIFNAFRRERVVEILC